MTARRVYLDHAATTPMVPEAIEAMTARARPDRATRRRCTAPGRAARRVVEEARESIAAQVGADPAEVIFTSGGTESDNLAVKGGYWSQAARRSHRGGHLRDRAPRRARRRSAWLGQSAGATARLLPVDPQPGSIRPRWPTVVDDEVGPGLGDLGAATRSAPCSRSREVAAAARAAGALVHSDAVQAVGHLPVDFAASGLDLLHLHRAQARRPVRDRRAAGPARGEPDPGPARRGPGAGRPVRHRRRGRGGRLRRRGRGRGREPRGRAAAASVRCATGWSTVVRSSAPGRRACTAPRIRRIGLPGVASSRSPGCSADSLLMLLDAAGIDCSTGSACSAGVSQPSHVLLAMGVTPRPTPARRCASPSATRSTDGRPWPARCRTPSCPPPSSAPGAEAASAVQRRDDCRPATGERVLAAMSGGVDSAVAAARAVDAGHDVTGVHLALSKNPQSYRVRSPRLLLQGGRPRRPAGRRRARHPLLRLGSVRPVRRRRGRRLRRRVRRRRAPRTRACAATRRSSSPRCSTGRSPSASTRSAPATTPGWSYRHRRCRAAPGRRPGQGPVVRARAC